ncbi:toll/interleukin-1 receptor domain-containing protein [Asaia lannensis]|uniref:toll/interleukin-1 receptor domain-containing protein n=1 Tax=Asaia lannensis TaxID=415421 RepID=UPI003872ABD5
MASLFFSYCHADEPLRDQLEKHLAVLKNQGVIHAWHDRRIGAGQEIDQQIDQHVETDDIILLLVSADFLASNYCYNIEMKRAVARHKAGEAIVIPVILRPCDWHEAPFGKLLGTPTDGKPITTWPNIDSAFLEVAKAVREAAKRVPSRRNKVETESSMPIVTAWPPIQATAFSLPRSSNLRVTKRFTDLDKDRFLNDGFDFIAKFFEGSLEEIQKRNPDITGTFRRIDANQFTAFAYRDGKIVCQCKISLGSYIGKGISYSRSVENYNNSFNENMMVEADDQSLFLRCIGISSRDQNGDGKLSFEGGAERYWSMFIEPLQRPERY